jgi:hypothetical protein
MALFEDVFTNIFYNGEVAGSDPDAEGDYYLVTDAQVDRNYMESKLWDALMSISTSTAEVGSILFGGVISDGGSGTINISEGVALAYDESGNKRIVHIPALTGVALPSGWNNDRQIWVTAKYDFKLGSATRAHRAVGTTYHYQLNDTYMGDSSGYVSTGTADLFTDSDPSATDVVLGSFKMNGTTYADQNVRSLLLRTYGPTYDYVIDSQAKFDALVASETWLGAKNVLFTTNVTRAAQTTIPATVEKIHAINGATLTVTDLTTGQYGFGYATVPTDPKFEIRNFAVNATGIGRISGFYSCTQLTNCTGTGTGSVYGYGYGFDSCTRLTNCTGTGTGTGADGNGYGFNSCTQLTNCTGTGTGADGDGVGFNSCTQLTNCTGTGTGTSGNGYGFNSCTQLTNCTGTGTGTGSVYGDGVGFNSCTQLTNCTGTGTGTSGNGYGFNSCTYAGFCRKGGDSTTATWSGTNTKIRGCEDISDDA